MTSPYYPFILNMWIMGSINEVKVQSYVPRFITQIECDAILVTPQVAPLVVQNPTV